MKRCILFLFVMLFIYNIYVVNSISSAKLTGELSIEDLVVDGMTPLDINADFNGTLKEFNITKDGFLFKAENIKANGTIGFFPFSLVIYKLNATSDNLKINITKNIMNMTGNITVFIGDNRYNVSINSLNATVKDFCFNYTKIIFNLVDVEGNITINTQKRTIKASSFFLKIYVIGITTTTATTLITHTSISTKTTTTTSSLSTTIITTKSTTLTVPITSTMTTTNTINQTRTMFVTYNTTITIPQTIQIRLQNTTFFINMTNILVKEKIVTVTAPVLEIEEETIKTTFTHSIIFEKAEEFLTKYGLWIAVGILIIILVIIYKYTAKLKSEIGVEEK